MTFADYSISLHCIIIIALFQHHKNSMLSLIIYILAYQKYTRLHKSFNDDITEV